MNVNLEKIVAGLVLTVLGVVLSWVLLRAIHAPQTEPPPRNAPPSAPGRQLVYFGATWCLPCRQMQGTLRDPKVAAALKDHDVKRFDLDRDRDLAARHGVTVVPTYLLLDPAGKELRRGAGYKSPADFLAWLEGG
jgi:thiol-disulfide isomerase/thioredoxin